MNYYQRPIIASRTGQHRGHTAFRGTLETVQSELRRIHGIESNLAETAIKRPSRPAISCRPHHAEPTTGRNGNTLLSVKLIGKMAHPLNWPRFDTERGADRRGLCGPSAAGDALASQRRRRFAVSTGIFGLQRHRSLCRCCKYYQDLFAARVRTQEKASTMLMRSRSPSPAGLRN